jgi:2,3-bisphosphoglycerate-dependent phosphoglycerate mutase
MTTVYLIRHAAANYANPDDAWRELTQQGLEDRKLVTYFLQDKNIETILSSPYKRAQDTLRDYAKKVGLPIITVADFRERQIGAAWSGDFKEYSRRQWADFDYKEPGGESLNEVQQRSVAALQAVLAQYPVQNIAIASHGTAISTIINYYDRSFGYAAYESIRPLLPLIVRLIFVGDTLQDIHIFLPEVDSISRLS